MAQEHSLAAPNGGAAMTSRRKRKRTDEALDPAERLRREKQRQAQALALKLRADGKDYRPPKKHKQPSKTEPTDATAQDVQPQKKSRNGSAKHQTQAVRQEPYKEETGFRPEEDVQVIIVPIFWNKQADEKATVLAAAEEVQGQLQEEGISAGLDSTNADTPGQKYRYWEQKGVKVRIELGPRDAQKSQACLAISTTPGEVAKKTIFQMGAPLTEAVHKALAASGLQPKATQPKKVSKDAMIGKKQQQSKLASPPAEAAEADAEITSADQPQAQEARQSATWGKAEKATSKATKHSGDDLGQDFDVDIDPSEEGGSKKKKNKSSVDKEGLVTAAKPSKHKSKTHKVVQF